MTLEQLSAAATQGMMDIAAGANCYCFDGRLRVGGKCIGFVAGDQTEDDDGQLHIIADADGQFIAELWNAYRTGQLVAVQPDDATVERMQEAYATFGQTGHLRSTPPSRECILAMIAAMKGPKP